MFKKIVNVISIVILVLLVLFVMFTLASRVMGNTPSLFGYYFFRVSSNSMEPTLDIGDVVMVKSVALEDIHKGDIITYKSQDGSMRGREVTHRVVDGPYEKDGKTYFQTKGDAVGAPLDKIITYDQIEGKFVRKLSLVSGFFGFISTPTGLIVFICVIVLVFGYELVTIFISYRKLDKEDKEKELNSDSDNDVDNDKDKSDKQTNQ